MKEEMNLEWSSLQRRNDSNYNTWWRELQVGILQPAAHNAITDVAGVLVGHTTLIRGDDCRTGVTAVLPHEGNIFQEKVPAAVYVANGFGKLIGYTQVEELGLLETPIVLTNTLSAPTAANALIHDTLERDDNQDVRSVNPVVGETNDSFLNNIRAYFVREEHVLQAIHNAAGEVSEGNVGAGTGTVCFGFKGGIGTASRILPHILGGYTIGALVQTNFGGILKINGAPVGEELGQYMLKEELSHKEYGSCMMILATDAPLNSRQLKRLARRAFQGFVRAGGFSSHGSGDYVVAFSTAHEMRYSHHSDELTLTQTILRNEKLTPLFLAAAEAVEEAIYHSLFAAEDMKGYNNQYVQALPHSAVKNILKKHSLLKIRKT